MDAFVSTETQRQKLVMEESFKDIEGLIHKTVRDFISRYKGTGSFWNYDDLFSDAHYIWADKFHRGLYNKQRAAFTTWTRLVVWGGLLEKLRTEMRHNNMCAREYPDMEQMTAPTEFDPEALLSKLSDDSQEVVRFVLEQPYQLLMNAQLLGNQEDLKKSLWDMFRSIGWTAERIAKCFQEVRCSL